jgi:hypothetical protein
MVFIGIDFFFYLMIRSVVLPFVEPIARNADLTGNLRGRPLPRIQQLHRLSLELRGEPSSLPHVATSLGAIVPPFEVSVNPS